MTIVAICAERSEPEAKIIRGLSILSEVSQADQSVRLGHGGLGAEGYEAPDLLVVSQASSATSAEKIAESYRRHGVACGRDLGGSYAFMLYDRAQRRLLATSDLTSRVPLAYWFRRGTVVVSSSVLRLLSHPEVARAVDETYLAHLATGYWAAPAGSTVLRDVKRLLPGLALIAERGRVELAPVDKLAPVRSPQRAKKFWVETLWRELEGAAARSLREPKPCLSLSGGLDSSLVASAARPARGGRSLESFSMVAPESGVDEGAAIDEAASAPALANHKVDCDACGDLSGLDELELPDDPFMMPLSVLPSRLLLWRQVSTSGFRTLIDGEGGDELFGALAGPRHALLEGQWRVALRYLRSQVGGRRMLFTRSVLVPSLPSTVANAWARRLGNEGQRLPGFLTARARTHPLIQKAGFEFYRGQIDEDLEGEFLRWLSTPGVVGAAATHRHLASSFGLTLASPMLDRRVVEVVLGMPSELLLSPVPKGFLREAAAGRVPDAVRTRPKDIRWPETFLRRIVASESVRAPLRDARVRERLGDWVRFDRLESMLEEIAKGHPLSRLLWHQIEGLVAFTYWYSRASREHGVD